MPAAITKIRRLRTGSLRVSDDSADMTDPYIVRVSEQVTKQQMLGLWVAVGGVPLPKVTITAIGGGYAICDSVEFEIRGNQRFIWDVKVIWKTLDDSSPKDQSQPSPNSNSVDPEDWLPAVTRSPVAVTEPMEMAYYEGGYSGDIHTNYAARTTAGDKTPVTNSAEMPFRDNLPQKRRYRSLFTMRWLRPGANAGIPGNLIQHEGKLNDGDVTFTHRGLQYIWQDKTALIEAVRLAPSKWGTLTLWEISIEVVHDPLGHKVTTLDKGMQEIYRPGEILPGTSATLPARKWRLIREAGERIGWEESLLNGEGKIGSWDDPKFGEWRDQETVDFLTIPLLQDLLT